MRMPENFDAVQCMTLRSFDTMLYRKFSALGRFQIIRKMGISGADNSSVKRIHHLCNAVNNPDRLFRAETSVDKIILHIYYN